MSTRLTAKRLDPRAYDALADALTAIFWNKQPFERYVRGALQDVPELLARLDFSTTKRETAGQLVDLLMQHEDRYQKVTIGLMLTVAKMAEFPNLAQQQDREQKIAQAREAVAELRKWTQRQQEIVDDHEQYAKTLAKTAEDASKSRALSE